MSLCVYIHIYIHEQCANVYEGKEEEGKRMTIIIFVVFILLPTTEAAPFSFPCCSCVALQFLQ